jgi:hypothetical protein
VENPAGAQPIEDEIERLRAERDQLAADAARLDRRVHGGRTRHFIVGLTVVLSCVAFLVGSLGFWVNRNLLDTDIWVERVGPLASDPAVQKALAAEMTNQAMSAIDVQQLFEDVLPERGQVLAIPLTGAIRGFVHDRVLKFVESDTFHDIWVAANETTHSNAVAALRGESTSKSVSVAGGKIVLSLVPAIDAVLARIATLSPEILGREVKIPKVTVNELPTAAREKLEEALGIKLDKNFGLITVYDGDALSTMQTALKWFDKAMTAAIVLWIALTVGAVVMSRRRRRTMLQLVVGFAIVLVLVRRVAMRAVEDVADLALIPANKAAVESVLHAFSDPLLNASKWMLVGLAVAALVLVLTGSYRWVVALRHGVVSLGRTTAHAAQGTVSAVGDKATSEPTAAWLTAHANALRWGGAAVFLAGLWWWDLSWLGLLLFALLVGAFELWVGRVVANGEHEDGPPAAPSTA